MRKLCFIGAGDRRGVREAPVEALRGAGEDGAMFRREIADGNNHFESLTGKFLDGFRTMGRDIDTHFAHGFDCQRIDD